MTLTRSFQGGGIQDVKFIPHNPETAALATAVHLGQVGFFFFLSILATFLGTLVF